MAKPKTPGTPGLAKKSAQILGVDATQVFQGLPNFGKFPRTEAGLYDYLRQGGMTQDAMEKILTDPDGAAAITQLQSWVNDPANQFKFAGTQPQKVEGASTETDAVSGEGRKPGEAYFTDPENMEAKIAAVMRATGVGGTPTKVTTIQGANGQWKHVVEFQNKDGTTGTVQVPAAAPGSDSAPKDTAPKEGDTAPKQATKKPPMSYDERVAAKKQSYEDAGKNPPPWMGATQAVVHGGAAVGRHLYQNSPTYMGGAVGLGATGLGIAGARALMGGGQQQQQQPPMEMSQQDIDRLNRSSMEMFGIPFKPSFQAPQPQAQPQPQVPQPQIPAGMPSDDQTTLLLRLAKSRSV